jgi:hypothetical protein
MLELKLNYAYDKRTNSIDIELSQSPITKDCYESNPIFKIKDINYDLLEKVGKKLAVVDFRTRPARYFDVSVNLTIFQTNGIEIMRESHQIKLENEKESLTQNFALIAKIRRIPIKKREQEFIQELISNTSISKLYPTEEIEKILTQNSIMWVKADPEITLIRQVNIPQQHIIYEYIKLFKEGDIVGQYETLKNIFESTNEHDKTITILETFIRSNGFYYKLRQYALKIYVKIILMNKREDGYLFLLEYLEDCYNEILKNKTLLNRDAYFILRKIIKLLGEYREEYFSEFVIVGKSKISSIQNKIIDKFLTILISNDLNIINGFNDAYIMREILLGSAKLNLQDKTFFLLKKIVKCLRIEKLKRSFNEIIIISSIEAFLTVLIKNDFFKYSYHNNCKALVEEIFNEINFYINSDCENYELKVYLSYFQIYLVFYKSANFDKFCEAIMALLQPGQDEQTSTVFLDSILPHYHTIYNLFEIINLKFDSNQEKFSLVNFTKEILFSKFAYYREDLRLLAEKVFNLVINKQTGEFYPSNNFNKNSINFGSKKYADEEWLYSFAKEDDRKEKDNDHDGRAPMQSEIGSETQSRHGTKQYSLLKKYQMKYPQDSYVPHNYTIDVERK